MTINELLKVVSFQQMIFSVWKMIDSMGYTPMIEWFYVVSFYQYQCEKKIGTSGY